MPTRDNTSTNSGHYQVKILLTELVTHDVLRFITEKPKNYHFTPGQATLVSLTDPSWEEEKRPFTFTSLEEDEVLEFIIKEYPDHDGVTTRLHQLSAGDFLDIEEPWGTINYQGPGTFIAGGAGITPFIAIFKDLYRKNKLAGNRLLFSNKTERDIIYEKEWQNIFPEKDLFFTLTSSSSPSQTVGENNRYLQGRFNKESLGRLINDINDYLYICGPKGFVKEVAAIGKDLGAKTDQIILEQ